MNYNYYNEFNIEEINPLDIVPESVRLYTVAQVAEILHTSRNYVYRLINCGLLKTMKIGTKKIRHDTLAEFLKMAEGKNLTDPKKIHELRTA